MSTAAWRRWCNQTLNGRIPLTISGTALKYSSAPAPTNSTPPASASVVHTTLRHSDGARGVISRFAQLSGRTFPHEGPLAEQLFFHLSAALERCHFHMGIDSSLQSEIEEKYPSLLRATRSAMIPLEAEYRIRFSREEMGLIAVIFGAWLMQETDLQEKQVVILSQSVGEQERKLKLQIRELTLLPLNIKFQSVTELQARGAPKNTVLVITPFQM